MIYSQLMLDVVLKLFLYDKSDPKIGFLGMMSIILILMVRLYMSLILTRA